MKLKIIMYFSLFVVINLSVSGFNMDYEPFYVLESIMIPIENNVIVFSRLVLNYAISLIIIHEFVNICYSIFAMYPFIRARKSHKGLIELYLNLSLRRLIIILFSKFVADLCTNNVCGFLNFSNFISIYISMFFTSILWMVCIFLFYVLFQKESIVFFWSLVLAFASQFIALKNSFFGIFSITYDNFYFDFKVLTLMKVICIVIILILLKHLLIKKEFIGGDKND